MDKLKQFVRGEINYITPTIVEELKKYDSIQVDSIVYDTKQIIEKIEQQGCPHCRVYQTELQSLKYQLEQLNAPEVPPIKLLLHEFIGENYVKIKALYVNTCFWRLFAVSHVTVRIESSLLDLYFKISRKTVNDFFGFNSDRIVFEFSFGNRLMILSFNSTSVGIASPAIFLVMILSLSSELTNWNALATFSMTVFFSGVSFIFIFYGCLYTFIFLNIAYFSIFFSLHRHTIAIRGVWGVL